MCFFFNGTATTEIYTHSLHDALPISQSRSTAAIPRLFSRHALGTGTTMACGQSFVARAIGIAERTPNRSEEHTSELQSRQYLVCRLLLEKKKTEEHIYVIHSREYYRS